MLRLKRVSREFDESGAFHELINLSGFADERTVITKSGEVLTVLSIRGQDPESQEPSQLDAALARLTGALMAFDDRYTVTSYLIKSTQHALEGASSCSNEFMCALLKSRYTHLAERRDQLFAYETYLVVSRKVDGGNGKRNSLKNILKHPRGALRRTFSTPGRVDLLDQQLNDACASLARAVDSFTEQIGDVFHVRPLDRDEVFTFLRGLLNPDRKKAEAIRLKRNGLLDFQIVDSELTCHRSHLRLGGVVLKVLTLKEPPAQTLGHMLGCLAHVAADIVVVSEWRPLEPSRAVREINARRRHFHNTKTGVTAQMSSEQTSDRQMLFDEGKEALVDDLGRCRADMELRGTQIGEYSLTFLVTAKTIADADTACAEVMRVLGAHEGALNEETYNGMAAFLAALPGGWLFNQRRLLITNRNHADLLPFGVPDSGDFHNAFLNAAALSIFETEQQSLFHFNFHVGEVGHAVLLGSSGSGKSFFLNDQIAQAQKYGGMTFILDEGGSYKHLTRAAGGSYLSVRGDDLPFSINIFRLTPTPANRQFQFRFVKPLIESGGFRMSEDEEKELFDGIDALAVLDRDQQRLKTLATTLGPGLGKHLLRWTEGEQYGRWFDHVEDTVSFARFQCINIEGISAIGDAREPLLFYFLHRAEQMIFDPARADEFKLCIVDEAWRFFSNPITCEFISTAFRTWRKKKAAIVLATQSANDLTIADAMSPILANCPTKILFANPLLDSGFYTEVLRLTPREQDRVRGLVPKRQFLLKQPDVSKVLSLNVDPRSYWLYTTNPVEANRRDELVATIGLDAALDFLAGGKQ